MTQRASNDDRGPRPGKWDYTVVTLYLVAAFGLVIVVGLFVRGLLHGG